MDRYLRLIAAAITVAQSTVHIYISATAEKRQSTGYYVPRQAEAQIRQGVDAWSQLQDRLRELAALNKERHSYLPIRYRNL
jgi:hypothetical protein